MDKKLEAIIDEVDAALYSGEDLTFNTDSLRIFKNILERWTKKVDDNIKFAEENLAESRTRSET